VKAVTLKGRVRSRAIISTGRGHVRSLIKLRPIIDQRADVGLALGIENNVYSQQQHVMIVIPSIASRRGNRRGCGAL